MDQLSRFRDKYAHEWQYRYDCGNALYRLGRYDQAVTEFRKCVELNRDFAWGHGNLAGALTAARRYREALTAVDAALAIIPNDFDFLENRRDVVCLLRRSRRRWALVTGAVFTALTGCCLRLTAFGSSKATLPMTGIAAGLLVVVAVVLPARRSVQ